MEVRIHKYRDQDGTLSPTFGEVWNSAADFYDANNASPEEYLGIENRYWQTVQSILNSLQVSSVKVASVTANNSSAEIGSDIEIVREAAKAASKINLVAGKELTMDQFEVIFRAALRQVLFLKIGGGDKGFFAHFGYDFYIYCGAESKFGWDSFGLTVEEFISPHH